MHAIGVLVHLDAILVKFKAEHQSSPAREENAT